MLKQKKKKANLNGHENWVMQRNIQVFNSWDHSICLLGCKQGFQKPSKMVTSIWQIQFVSHLIDLIYHGKRKPNEMVNKIWQCESVSLLAAGCQHLVVVTRQSICMNGKQSEAVIIKKLTQFISPYINILSYCGADFSKNCTKKANLDGHIIMLDRCVFLIIEISHYDYSFRLWNVRVKIDFQSSYIDLSVYLEIQIQQLFAVLIYLSVNERCNQNNKKLKLIVVPIVSFLIYHQSSFWQCIVIL
ncbi:unnamed protein product [Paramecium pentaurelia]|uniref:Uncharacterized protein n=1 Tax=Paramecium pentaurelia TaxID=43138 RepID=A0A8S1YLP4_9CILI|nr:unnamed protein product [Paramecium pentaurelia]